MDEAIILPHNSQPFLSTSLPLPTRRTKPRTPTTPEPPSLTASPPLPGPLPAWAAPRRACASPTRPPQSRPAAGSLGTPARGPCSGERRSVPGAVPPHTHTYRRPVPCQSMDVVLLAIASALLAVLLFFATRLRGQVREGGSWPRRGFSRPVPVVGPPPGPPLSQWGRGRGGGERLHGNRCEGALPEALP